MNNRNNNNALDTISAAATAIASAESRTPQAIQVIISIRRRSVPSVLKVYSSMILRCLFRSSDLTDHNSIGMKCSNVKV